MNRKNVAACLLIACLGTCGAGPVWGQSSTRGSRQSGTQSVSSDLIQLYETTSSAKSPSDFSKIIAMCEKAANGQSRSRLDRLYAERLLSWAANRRGEVLSDMAAEKVAAGETDIAARYDADARADFELALQYQPERWRARHNLAIAMALQNQTSAAIEQFTLVIEQKPEYANAYFNRGEMYFQLGEYRQAVEDYDLAIDRADRDPENYSARAHAKFFLKEYDSAIRDYEMAMQLDPNSPDLACDYADACQSIYRWRDSGLGYKAALQIDADHERSLQNAAWLMATSPDKSVRNPSAALRAIDRLFALGVPKDYRMWDTIAAAQAANGEFGRAAASISKSLASAPIEERADLQYRAEMYRDGRAYMQTTPPDSIAQGTSDATIRQDDVKFIGTDSGAGIR